QRVESLEYWNRSVGRERVLVPTLVSLEIDRERRQHPRHREEIGSDRCAELTDFRRLIAQGSVHGTDLVVDSPNRAQVDQLDRIAGLDDVVGLQITEEQAGGVQIAECRQHL